MKKIKTHGFGYVAFAILSFLGIVIYSLLSGCTIEETFTDENTLTEKFQEYKESKEKDVAYVDNNKIDQDVYNRIISIIDEYNDNILEYDVIDEVEAMDEMDYLVNEMNNVVIEDEALNSKFQEIKELQFLVTDSVTAYLNTGVEEYLTEARNNIYVLNNSK